jgi:hypothetical protein
MVGSVASSAASPLAPPDAETSVLMTPGPSIERLECRDALWQGHSRRAAASPTGPPTRYGRPLLRPPSPRAAELRKAAASCSPPRVSAWIINTLAKRQLRNGWHLVGPAPTCGRPRSGRRSKPTAAERRHRANRAAAPLRCSMGAKKSQSPLHSRDRIGGAATAPRQAAPPDYSAAASARAPQARPGGPPAHHRRLSREEWTELEGMQQVVAADP